MRNPGETGNEPVPQGGDLGGVFRHVGAGFLQRRRHTRDGRDILRPRPFPPLLGAALNQIGQRHSLPGVQ